MLALCLLCLFAATGCSVTRGTRAPDGQITITNYRLLWTTEAVDFRLSTLDSGLATQLKIGHSASDDKSVGAITEGAVKGLTRP